MALLERPLHEIGHQPGLASVNGCKLADRANDNKCHFEFGNLCAVRPSRMLEPGNETIEVKFFEGWAVLQSLKDMWLVCLGNKPSAAAARVIAHSNSCSIRNRRMAA